jgi:hypothetical protein
LTDKEWAKPSDGRIVQFYHPFSDPSEYFSSATHPELVDVVAEWTRTCATHGHDLAFSRYCRFMNIESCELEGVFRLGTFLSVEGVVETALTRFSRFPSEGESQSRLVRVGVFYGAIDKVSTFPGLEGNPATVIEILKDCNKVSRCGRGEGWSPPG